MNCHDFVKNLTLKIGTSTLAYTQNLKSACIIGRIKVAALASSN